MTMMSIEMLPADRIDQMWPQLEPLYAAACKSHEIAQSEMDAEAIRKLAVEGLCAIFVMYYGGKIGCTLAIQFHETNGQKGADIIAMAGEKLMMFRRAYWHIVLEWLRANGVKFVDAYVPEERTDMYKRKFGFGMSCGHVRMTLA